MSQAQLSSAHTVRRVARKGARTCFPRWILYVAAAWLCLTLIAFLRRSAPDVEAVLAYREVAGTTDYLVDHSTQEARTFMQCIGGRIVTRACHFVNLYYNLESKRFAFFGAEGVTPEMFGGTMREERQGEPWLKLIRGEMKWRQPEEKAQQFHMDWLAGEDLPAPDEVATYQHPVHLRTPHFTYSIGHLLRDNLQYLVDLPIRFGRDPVTFDWVRWEGEMDLHEWEEEHPTAIHYRGLVNNRPSLTWQEVIDKALSGMPAGVKYIRLLEVIGGTGATDLEAHMGRLGTDPGQHVVGSWAHMCKPFPFAAMRQVAYQNHGLQVTSVADLEPFILFLNGQADEKRHIANAMELIPKLRQTFPGVRIGHSEISAHPLQAQLELISRSTILISNVGSRSFRLIYLPNGATTILVGPVEFAFMVPSREAGQPDVREVIALPFQEIEWCWGFIGYVNMLQYHVTNQSEVIREQRKNWRSWIQARNTDIVLDEDKITALIRVALQRSNVRQMQHGIVHDIATTSPKQPWKL